MNCPTDSDLLHSVLDGEADAETASSYHDHLGQCGDCRQRHDFHDRLKGMLSTQVRKETTPDPMRERLMARLRQERTTAKVVPLPVARPTRAWWTRGVLAAASLGLVSTASLYQLTPRSSALAASLAAHHCVCGATHGAGPCPDPTPIAQASFGSAPEVASFPALSPYDVKVCPLDRGGNALHVVYHDSSSQTVSMFGVPEAQGGGLQLAEAQDAIMPQMISAQDQNVAAWKRHGWVYSLVSKMPPSQLQTLATQGRYGGLPAQRWASSTPLPGGTSLPVAQPAVFHQ